jgi:hypothetical protein
LGPHLRNLCFQQWNLYACTGCNGDLVEGRLCLLLYCIVTLPEAMFRLQIFQWNYTAMRSMEKQSYVLGTFTPVQDATETWSKGGCVSFCNTKSFTGPAMLTTPLLKERVHTLWPEQRSYHSIQLASCCMWPELLDCLPRSLSCRFPQVQPRNQLLFDYHTRAACVLLFWNTSYASCCMWPELLDCLPRRA